MPSPTNRITLRAGGVGPAKRRASAAEAAPERNQASSLSAPGTRLGPGGGLLHASSSPVAATRAAGNLATEGLQIGVEGSPDVIGGGLVDLALGLREGALGQRGEARGLGTRHG